MTATATATALAREFLAGAAARCGPGEAALVLVCETDGLSVCVSSEPAAHEVAAAVSADGLDDDDLLLPPAVVAADGTVTYYQNGAPEWPT